ncbi:MAG: riboflavin synthase [Candidatus Omnitrophota bacterium]|nr:MAG: riboflavin synthase [Candidatus Omnitrophota bacterium]
MFTGIIEQTGIIKNLSKKKDIYRLDIYIKKNLDSIKAGSSVSINGVCLTVVDLRKNHVIFDIMKETFLNTSFRHLKNNDVVNIESSLKWAPRIDGHFVLGHIDRIQRIKSIEKHTRPYIDVTLAPDDKIYIVKKGSIAIDGISLTIGEVYKDKVRAYIIPYTLKNTNLKYKKKGDPVNIEFDILGKYIHNSLLYKRDIKLVLTKESLKKNGFI